MTHPNLTSPQETHLSTLPFEPDDGFEFIDEALVGKRRHHRHGVSAWEHLERSAEYKRLREQLSDWENFEDHPSIHDL